MADYIKKASKGTAFLLTGTLLGSFFAYLTKIYLARNLTVTEFGLFSAIFTFFSLLSIFKDFGLSEALVKFAGEYLSKKQFQKAASLIKLSILIQTGFALLVLALTWLFLDKLSIDYFKEEAARNLIIIIGLWFVTSTILGSVFEAFYCLQSFFYLSLKNPLKNGLYLLILIACVSLGYGVLSPAYALLSSSIILTAIFVPILIAQFNVLKYKLSDVKFLTKKMILFGIPVIISMMGAKIIGYADTLMLTYFRTLDEVGIYNVVLPTSLLLLLLSRTLATVIYPLGCELWTKKEHSKINAGLSLAHKYIFIIATPATVILIIFSSFFLEFLFGVEYITGTTVFQILAIGTLFMVAGQINNSIITSSGSPVRVTQIVLLAAGINILGNLVLIPPFGIIGAGIATALSYFMIFIFSLKELKKMTNFKTPWKIWSQIILIGFILFGAGVGIRKIISLTGWTEVITTIAILTIPYISLILLFRIITFEEVRKIAKKIVQKA